MKHFVVVFSSLPFSNLSAHQPLTNPLVQMTQYALSVLTLGLFVCLHFFFVCVPLLCVLLGRGGGREQKEHTDQTDAKADPTPRGGDNQTETPAQTCRHMHNHDNVL